MAKPSIDVMLGAPEADEEEAPASEKSESIEDFDSAASECLAAIKAGDESAFKEALRACVMSIDS